MGVAVITRVKQNKTEHEISVHPQTVHHHNPYILLTSVTGFTLPKQAGQDVALLSRLQCLMHLGTHELSPHFDNF